MNRLTGVIDLKELLKYHLKIISQKQDVLDAAGVHSASWKIINHRPMSLSIKGN